MDIKCPMCKRKLGYVARANASGKFFCTACDIWVNFVKKDGKVSYRIRRPGR